MDDEPSETSARKLTAKRTNERIKYFVSFLNALGIGMIAAGVIVPATKTPVEIALISTVWFVGGFVLHLVGHAIFAFLRSEE